MVTRIDELFNMYLERQDELVKLYENKYIVFTADKVDAFDDKAEGYDFGVETYGLGNFILQLCTKGDEAYSMRLYSPVFS